MSFYWNYVHIENNNLMRLHFKCLTLLQGCMYTKLCRYPTFEPLYRWAIIVSVVCHGDVQYCE